MQEADASGEDPSRDSETIPPKCRHRSKKDMVAKAQPPLRVAGAVGAPPRRRTPGDGSEGGGDGGVGAASRAGGRHALPVGSWGGGVGGATGPPPPASGDHMKGLGADISGKRLP